MANVDAHCLEDWMFDWRGGKVQNQRLDKKIDSFISCSIRSGCQPWFEHHSVTTR